MASEIAQESEEKERKLQEEQEARSEECRRCFTSGAGCQLSHKQNLVFIYMVYPNPCKERNEDAAVFLFGFWHCPGFGSRGNELWVHLLSWCTFTVASKGNLARKRLKHVAGSSW